MLQRFTGTRFSECNAYWAGEPEFDYSAALLRWSKPPKLNKDEIKTEETFTQMLLRLMKEKGMGAPTLCYEACMDRKLFSKIKTNVNYQPKKYTAIQLALGLKLSLAETRTLLEAAGFALSPGIREDKVISDCIEQGKGSVWQVNRMLKAYGLKALYS